MKKTLYFLAISISLPFELSIAMRQACRNIKTASATQTRMACKAVNDKIFQANADFLFQSTKKLIDSKNKASIIDLVSKKRGSDYRCRHSTNEELSSFLDIAQQIMKKDPIRFKDRIEHISKNHEFSWEDITCQEDILEIDQLNRDKTTVSAILSENLNFINWIKFDSILDCDIYSAWNNHDWWYIVLTLQADKDKIAGACCGKSCANHVQTTRCDSFKLVLDFRLNSIGSGTWSIKTMYPLIIKDDAKLLDQRIIANKTVQQIIKHIKQSKFDDAFAEIETLSSAVDFSTFSTVINQKDRRTIRNAHCMRKFLQDSCSKGNFNAFKFLWYVLGFSNDEFTGIVGAFWPDEHAGDSNLAEIIKMITTSSISRLKSNMLMTATYHGNYKIVESLLQNNANPNIVDVNDCTSLIFAAQNGHYEIVQLLLDKGADPNIASKNGNTSLIAAAQEGHDKIVELLLKNEANPNLTRNTDGCTALMLAADNGHDKIVELLLKNGANTNLIRNADGCTALMFAAQNGHDKIVELLLKSGANTNLVDVNGSTALMLAAYNGYYKIVELLLKSGANTNLTRNSDGCSALMVAAQNGHDKIVELLLKNGASCTALMIAVQNGHDKIVELLLQNNANPNLAHVYGLTALMFASANGQMRIVQLLLENGANPNLQSADGRTAAKIASDSGHKDIARQILEYIVQHPSQKAETK